MLEVTTSVPLSPDAVFAVLADGWSYSAWVVGASHVREVDEGWPEPGTRIHHAVGPWPLVINDATAVVALDRPRLLELDARVWTIGTARVRLELTEVEPQVTEIRMTEHLVDGLGRVVPQAVQALVLRPRNREALRRLSDLAIGRHGSRAD